MSEQSKASAAPQPVPAVRAVRIRPAYMPIDAWLEFSGTGRTTAYEHITTGKIRSILVGRRRLVDVEHGLAYLASLAVVDGARETGVDDAHAGDGATAQKRGRGRPRIHPLPEPAPTKRPRGRPRKHPVAGGIFGGAA